MTLYRERRTAMLAALGLHIAALGLAAVIWLDAPVRTRRSISIVLQVPVQLQTPEVAQRPAKRSGASSGRVAPRQPSQLESVPRERESIISAAAPETVSVDTSRTWRLPGNVLDPDITPEQAWKELTQLLEKHPQFKDMVVREMLAGSGFVQDSLPPVSFHLDDVLKFEKFLPSWMYEAMRVQSQYGGYSPVMGHRRVEQYTGPQLNVISALKYLYDLIEGK